VFNFHSTPFSAILIFCLLLHVIASDPDQKIALTAVNDALLIESVIYALLRLHFRDSPEVHLNLLDEFHTGKRIELFIWFSWRF
tara:strand:- start:45 stop:296 length:252 start_codon:yes stop_codon:yes gene_type:complete